MMNHMKIRVDGIVRTFVELFDSQRCRLYEILISRRKFSAQMVEIKQPERERILRMLEEQK